MDLEVVVPVLPRKEAEQIENQQPFLDLWESWSHCIGVRDSKRDIDV